VVRYGAQTAVLLWLFLWSGWIVTIETVYWIILATAAAGILAVSFNVHDLEWPAGGWGEISLRHWHFSKWLLASNLLSWASGHVFILFAGAIIGAAAVGTLRAAQNVMAVTHVLFLGLGNFLPVRASEVYTEGGIVRLKKFLWKASVFVISTTLVFASIVCVFADEILTLLYGSTYGDYGWVLIGYALIYVLVALGTVIPIGLLALERTGGGIRTSRSSLRHHCRRIHPRRRSVPGIQANSRNPRGSITDREGAAAQLTPMGRARRS
jgi:O-antigen/teichoic acid export membrane protein